MDDVPTRANAAQMASRTIRNAKNRRRFGPVQSTGAPQSMSFGTSGPGGGGLFGGSVQAAGSFDFSAPGSGPQIQFPPSPFGGNNVFGSTSDNEDPRLDTTGEEAKRRHMPFQQDTTSKSTPSSAPVQSNLFGGQQGFAFNSMNGQAPQAGNPFTFQTTQPTLPGSTGFASTPVQNKPASNTFNFSAPPSQPASPSPSFNFGSGPPQDKPASNTFNFSQTPAQQDQSSTSTFNFGSSAPPAAQDKPANNPFSFASTQPSNPGAFASTTPAQASDSNIFGSLQTPSTSGINFGSTPANENPITDLFGTSPSKSLFGGVPQQSTATSTEAEKPTSNMFGAVFGGASQQSAVTSNAAEKPTPNIFGTVFGGAPQHSTQTSNTTEQSTASLFATSSKPLIGGAPQQSASNSIATEKPTTNMFGNSSSNPLSGGASQQSAPTSNLFAHLNTSASSSTNLFNSQQEAKPVATPSTNLFAHLNTAASSSSNIFSNQQEPEVIATPSASLPSNLDPSNKPAHPTSNLFAEPKSAAKGNLFGAKPTSSLSDLFGNLNKPVEQPATQPKGNDTSSINSHGGSSLFSASTPQPSTPVTQANGTAPFSPMKPSDAPSSAIQPPPSGMFPNLPPPTSANSSDASRKSETTAAGITAKNNPSSSNKLVNGNGTTEVDYESLYIEMADASSITDEQLAPLVPTRFSDSQKNEFYAAYRLRSLNKAVKKFFTAVPFGTGFSNLIAYYNEKKVEILDRSSLPIPGSKRRYTDVEDPENHSSSKRSRQVPPPKSAMFQPQLSSKLKTSDERDVDQENTKPIKRSRPEVASTSNIFQAAQTQTKSNRSPEKPRNEYQPQPNLNESTAKEDIAALEKQIEDADRQLATTYNALMRNRLEHNLRKLKSDLQLKSSSLPKAPSFAPPSSSASPLSWAPPMASPSPASAAIPSTKGKRKAEVQLTKDDHDKEEQEGRRMRPPNMDGDTNGSNTSNIFKGIVDSPSKASPVKKNVSLPSASSSKDNAPRTNPFGSLPMPKSPTKPAASLPGPPSNMFAPHPSSNGTSTSLFAQTPNIVAPKLTPNAASINLFTPKPSSNGTSTNPFASKPASSDSKSDAIEAPQVGPPKFGPPQFGTGAKVDFLAQFGAKAKARDEVNEHKLMVKAMEEDLDSDDDEETREEWIAEYTATRKAKLEELEQISKSGLGVVPGGKGPPRFLAADGKPLFGTADGQARGVTADKDENVQSLIPPLPLFAQSMQSPIISGLSSRTSTPGPNRSGTGSVLDGHAPGQSLMFGTENIFGHLSPAAESPQEDEDTASESDEEDEEDSENKDPNYVPGDDSGSGPGTPVEETGPGIASAKKPTSTNIFAPSPLSSGGLMDRITMGPSSGTSTPGRGLSLADRITGGSALGSGGSISGTSTPGGGPSLFDRISKDSNSDPVKENPTDNKENTQPTTIINNPFANLNKSPAAPADQTWKPDTPIKFGSTVSTPTDSANPKLSITEATPTKTSNSNLFFNLNNSVSTPKQPFSDLFGSSAIKTTLGAPTSAGFTFGSPGVSLFPSAAASATTSRATSPGNTTDGASDYEDPDAEKHEQLDLTSGGPGEENEEAIHEVRAKANEFIPGEGDGPGSWKPKGVGILRVLKHKELSATRIVLRGDPSGKVILNKSLLAKVNYTADKKTVKFLAAADGSSGLETWLLQVKTEAMAAELATVLEANK